MHNCKSKTYILPHNFIIYHSRSGFKDNFVSGYKQFLGPIMDKCFGNQGVLLALFLYEPSLYQIPRPTATKFLVYLYLFNALKLSTTQ